MRLLIVAIFLLFSGFAIAQTSDLGKTAPTMLENKGQVSNSDGTPADHVLFYMNTPQLDFYLTKTGISYVFKKIEIIPEKGNDQADPKLSLEKTTVYSHRVDVTAIGAKICSDKAEVEYSNDRTVSIYNGLVPQGLENMKPVRTVTLKNVYPGIDWQFVVQDENIKYNFILHQGADLNSIKLSIDGQNKLSFENEKLTIHTSYGTLTEGPLVSFLSTGEPVDIKQNLQENILTFSANNLPALQDGQTLTIDPPLVWATFFGGSGNDQVKIIERSLDGFVYMLLETLSSDFPVMDSSLLWMDSTYNTNTDIGILKFNDNGKLVWSSYYGGSGLDKPYNMYCNNTFFAIVGSTQSSNFPLQPFAGAYNQSALKGSQDAFVIVFGKTNPIYDQRIWGTLIGGYSNFDAAWDCSFYNNHLYVVGDTKSDSAANWNKPNSVVQFPIQSKAGAYNQNVITEISNGKLDVFISEFGLGFPMTWSTFYGGSNDDCQPQCEFDSVRRFGIALPSASTDLPPFSTMSGSYLDALSGLLDIGFTMFNQNGQRIMHTFIGGALDDIPKDIICNRHNEWLITGSVRSNDFPVANNIGAGFHVDTLSGNYNAFLVKLDSVGSMDYSTYYGGGMATGYGLTIDSHENTYLVGSTKLSMYTYNPLDGSYVDSTINNGTTVHDGFMLELDSSFNPKWATVIGGSGDD
ncbi:MAG TPA: hypothetical protein PLA88_03490, partial [Bacteroidales bacterium]|nr:hypothetical protein [Bacteroidales bacterium]